MSSRIIALDPSQVSGKTADLFAAIKAGLGVVPNLMRTIGHSPAALEAYLGFGKALGAGVLPARTREQLALAISQANQCDYCLSAHSYLGKATGLAPAAITDARRGNAADPKVDALLKFAQAVVEARGQVGNEAVAAVRAAGASDAEIVEIVAHVAVNTFTNYLNHIADTAVDFPKAETLSQ